MKKTNNETKELRIHGMFEPAEGTIISKVEIGSYPSNFLAMGMEIYAYDEELGCDEAYATVTVNIGNDIGNETLMPLFCSYVENEDNAGFDVHRFLTENGLAEPYMRRGEEVVGYSGYCSYQLFQFNADKMRELDPEGAEAYEKTYWKRFDKERKCRADVEFALT